MRYNENMFLAFESVFVIIMVISVGIVLAKRNWFEKKASALISRLVVSITLPAYMISNLIKNYDSQKLISMIPGLPIPFILLICANLISFFLVKILREPKGRCGTFITLFSFSNAIFIGMPVNLLVFGDASLPYILLFYIANATCFWTIGSYSIALDGAIRKNRIKPSFFSIGGLRQMFPPPLLGFIVAVVIIFLNIKIPKVFLTFFSYLGSVSAPLSMIFIGIVISNVRLADLKHNRNLVLMAVTRIMFLPLIMYILVINSNLPILMKKVFILQSAMPATSQPPIIADAFGADAEYAGIGVSISTVLSLITIPIYVILVNMLIN